MSSRTASIGHQFNRSAGSYDTHAHVQRMMANWLVESLQGWESRGDTGGPDILEIGCGTGALTEVLLNTWFSASITALDIAPAMIKMAERRILSTTAKNSDYRKNPSDRLRFLHADVEMWASNAPTSSCDLIVSNACFQWLSKPEQTLSHLRRILRTGGLLVFTTFGPDTFYELHMAFNEVYRANGIKPQRHGLSFQSIAQWNHLLKESGFSSVQYERSFQIEKYASVRDFLLSVKAMGASTSEAVTMRGLSSRRLFSDMYKEYEDKFSIQGGVAASYDLLLIQARGTLG
ncbi:Trans-aconitate 2-methyltransferase [Paenibacillus larvae subsp. larvae]|uniref:Malonyl-[acyl-carrier protein] O-methyltransferase n=2 Tax=Paenibacillus larvae TaxID=1464 RepID=A0A2L1U733_9BACL|nr:malonyl-ACP O-methyltransferase BioC [Paenibacillus larvae]AQT84958.1 malonyl-[acyl-carrier protein] O-methyltransferase BioC [Paenibacillus larvae subsp. pulvifaciens]AQZ46961.1 malonyl-[acyl-carrier protein] O-methyltransferase BioC [Paenibacillus larvae subsp. pulvifaciens]ARF68334.1 malonyl-[acyl-carrier protein] O-methyltransferase BioC [Paenibacillus larvae subsp. pulvifaciens]AVF28736.1 Trans-aconitate 2-methyltransferase [Paenibacillus larvae subsp. larvae]AVF33242.1 Trans-aconitate